MDTDLTLSTEMPTRFADEGDRKQKQHEARDATVDQGLEVLVVGVAEPMRVRVLFDSQING